MQVIALDPINQPMVDEYALAIGELEIAARNIGDKLAKVMLAAPKFEKTITLPAGWFGYKKYDWEKYPLDASGQRYKDAHGNDIDWMWNRPTAEVGAHPSQFQNSRSKLMEIGQEIGELLDALNEFHEAVVYDCCNVRVLPEGCGK